MKFIVVNGNVDAAIKKMKNSIAHKKVNEMMTLQVPGQLFPFDTGLGLGLKWGQLFDFEYDKETLSGWFIQYLTRIGLPNSVRTVPVVLPSLALLANQHLNIRSLYLPFRDDEYLLSIDYSGQELKAATMLSQEPVWVEAFSTGQFHLLLEF